MEEASVSLGCKLQSSLLVTSSCTLRCSETQLSLTQFHCLERVCKCLFIVFRGLCKSVVCRWIVFVFSAFPVPVCRLAFFLTCTLHNIYSLSNFSIFNQWVGNLMQCGYHLASSQIIFGFCLTISVHAFQNANKF
jgi:hypothetical protein